MARVPVGGVPSCQLRMGRSRVAFGTAAGRVRRKRSPRGRSFQVEYAVQKYRQMDLAGAGFEVAAIGRSEQQFGCLLPVPPLAGAVLEAKHVSPRGMKRARLGAAPFRPRMARALAFGCGVINDDEPRLAT